MRKFALLFIVLLYGTFSGFRQTSVRGKITDSKNGVPIAGASIKVRGEKVSAVSLADGSFELNSVSNSGTLEVTEIGHNAQTIKFSGSKSIEISMLQNTQGLSEVVVTALGISRNKKSINYSAQSVNAESIENGGRANLIDDINGKVSGVQITNAGGQAGSGTTIVIRGYNSLTGNNQPLYVVDGIPIDNSAEQGSGSAYNVPTANRAVDISPDDIESLTVLKGGAATALYGIQASNGAIVITTKKGKSGKVNIEAGYGYSLAMANKYPAFSHGYMRGTNGKYNTSTTNNWGPLASSNPVFPSGLAKLDLDGSFILKDVTGQKIPFYPNNYQNFFINGLTNKYNLALSGGNDKSTFYVGLIRLDQNGIVRNNSYDKTSAVINVTNQVTERLKLDFKFNYINTGGLRFDAGRMMNSLDYYVNTWDIVNYPWKNPGTAQETWWQKSISSPMWTVHETGEKYRINRYISNHYCPVKIKTCYNSFCNC